MVVVAALIYLYFDEKKQAIRKAEAGEWQEGDAALENAKKYINADGEIIAGEVAEQVDIENGRPMAVNAK